MRKGLLLLWILVTIVITGCGGGDGDSGPSDISGTWFGDGYIAGNYIQLTLTFHPLEMQYYQVDSIFRSPRYGTQTRKFNVFYDGNSVHSNTEQINEVTHDSMTWPVRMEESGGTVITGTITLYRQ